MQNFVCSHLCIEKGSLKRTKNKHTLDLFCGLSIRWLPPPLQVPGSGLLALLAEANHGQINLLPSQGLAMGEIIKCEID